MYLLLSGEGPGDIGMCYPAAGSCNMDTFQPGPMSWMIDQLVESFLGYEYSHIECSRAGYVSESYLADNKPKRLKKSMSLRGKKTPPEFKYYYENARALAIAAKAIADEINDSVIAVLFRDSDGTASAGRGNWRDKRNSMIKGFDAEGYEFGVPMVPRPKSEAWLLCAVKERPYQHCDNLEDESGNDNAANPLKAQLSVALGGNVSTADIIFKVKRGDIDVHRIAMPSFSRFTEDLERAVNAVIGGQT